MNKTIFITGGAIRIGKEICKKFHQEGFNIICHYNSSSNFANQLSEELNEIRKGSCELIQFDLNEINKYPDFIKKVKSLYESIDILINNASAFYSSPLNDYQEKDWDILHNSNLRGPFLISSFLKETISKNNGTIINITDAMVIRGMKDYSIYSAAEALDLEISDIESWDEEEEIPKSAEKWIKKEKVEFSELHNTNEDENFEDEEDLDDEENDEDQDLNFDDEQEDEDQDEK